MDGSPGFAGLGASVRLISSLGDDQEGGPREITAAILRDAALTAKLLRIANSSRNARGGRNISTIDQALVILGLNTVKSVALSLALLDSLSSRPQSKLLHAEIVAAYFCGSLCYEITRLNAPRFNAQEAQVCGLMQNLGRMMATYYLYEEVELVRALQADENLAEDEAVLRTLGMSFAEIGAAIARHWSLADVLQASLAPDDGKAPPRAVVNALTWQQLCSSFCHKITDALFRLPENRERSAIAQHVEFFRLALHLKEDEVGEWIAGCLANTDAVLADMAFPCDVAHAQALLRKASERVLDLLAAGDSLTRQSNSVGGRTPVEVIQQGLRTIHDKCNFDRTLMCLPDGAAGLTAIAGVGRSAVQVTSKFRCRGPKPDLFRAIMARKIDAFIADVNLPAYAKLVPDWYREFVGARSFTMLALVHEGKLLGMIYGDFAEQRAGPPPELADEVVRDWREQLIQALRAGATKPL
ncbi:MAG: HDOD domain-containing protein [Rhodocyclaceae bacterium]|nr:HDOD domain-containing protein [Rhodocyclaceae bacterium]